MNRISLFKTRIIIEDKVYLLARDVRKAFGYNSIEQLQFKHADIVKQFKDLPALVSESDFNTILSSDIEAMKELKHIEITRVETLRNHTEAIKCIYPLKLMVAGKMFENEAKNAGYQSINDYIENIDFVRIKSRAASIKFQMNKLTFGRSKVLLQVGFADRCRSMRGSLDTRSSFDGSCGVFF